MARTVDDQIKIAAEFGEKIENVVVSKGQFDTGERNTPLMAYWSLGFEFQKAILKLLSEKLHGAAFALVRPLIECTIRAHLVIFVKDEVLKKILADEYRTNFGQVGKEIDAAYGTGDFFEKFLDGAKHALHGYTHVGTHQLGRRFAGMNLMPSYSDEEIIEVIRTSTSAVFMLNNIAAKHLGFEEEWKETNNLFEEWGKT